VRCILVLSVGNYSEQLKYHAQGPMRSSYRFIWVNCQFALCPLLACVSQWSRVCLEKLTVAQLLKKFPFFYRTRRFTALFTRPAAGRHLSQINPVHIPTLYCPKVRFNIISPLQPELQVGSSFEDPQLNMWSHSYLFHACCCACSIAVVCIFRTESSRC
jgi:hypothetical protein